MHTILGTFVLAALLSQGGAGRADGLAAADREAVLRVTQEYRDAWLANDPARVMATLADTAVLLPSGMAPIDGEAAIRRFWFPSPSTTTVTAMEQMVRSVRGSGRLAVVRGDGTLTFVASAGAPVTQRSWFVNVLEKDPNGRWRIVERAWSDLRR